MRISRICQEIVQNAEGVKHRSDEFCTDILLLQLRDFV